MTTYSIDSMTNQSNESSSSSLNAFHNALASSGRRDVCVSPGLSLGSCLFRSTAYCNIIG